MAHAGEDQYLTSYSYQGTADGVATLLDQSGTEQTLLLLP